MTSYAGWQLVVRVAASTAYVTGSSAAYDVDGIQRLEYDYVQNLTAHEATGQRTAYVLTEGIIGLTGTLERFWTGSTNWARGTGETGALGTYYIGAFPDGTGSTKPFILLNGCKFDSQRISHRPSAQLMTESLGFRGLNLITGSCTY